MELNASSAWRKTATITGSIILLVTAHVLIMSQSGSRMYWPYMLSSYFLATAVLWLESPRRTHNLKEYFFSSQIWLHRSSVNDYGLFIVNYLVIYSFLYHHMPELTFITELLNAVMNMVHLPKYGQDPGLIAITVFTIATILVNEFTYYITHWAYHKYPFLWELHKVHHSAEVMTPLTYIRSHPIDILIQIFMRMLGITICSAVFYYLFPTDKGALTIAGVNAGIFMYYIVGAALHHSHIWISYWPWLEHILISPAQHQIHHSIERKHYDKNFGSMLAVWDWVFGTLYITREKENVTFGIGPHESKNYDSVFKLLWNPMKAMGLMILKPIRKNSKT